MPVMTLRKVAWNKGVTDNGVEYDYTRITCEIPIYEGSPKEFGVETFELEYGPESRHHELLHLRGKLPVQVEIGYMEAKKGKQLIRVVQSLRVLDEPKDGKVPPVKP